MTYWIMYITRTDFFWDSFRQLICSQVETSPVLLISFLHPRQQMSPVVSNDFRNGRTAFRTVEMPFRNFPISQSRRLIRFVELKIIYRYDAYYTIIIRLARGYKKTEYYFLVSTIASMRGQYDIQNSPTYFRVLDDLPSNLFVYICLNNNIRILYFIHDFIYVP